MTTPSGTISLSDVNAELGYSPTALIGMNDSAVRGLAGVGGAGTIISMNDLRGKSNRVALSITISANTTNYDAYTSVSGNPAYVAGNTDATITINAGVTVYSTSTGTAAFAVPASFNPGDTVTLVNNGTIVGRGGNGGNGGTWYGPLSGAPGSPAGGGLQVLRPTTVTNNNRIAGGGGGGGGSNAYQAPGPNPDAPPVQYGGSGGGGGVANGSGGAAGYGPNGPGSAGSPGTLTAGGPGASPGGGYGSAGGGAGGAAGYAVSGDPYITWPAFGTRNGPVS